MSWRSIGSPKKRTKSGRVSQAGDRQSKPTFAPGGLLDLYHRREITTATHTAAQRLAVLHVRYQSSYGCHVPGAEPGREGANAEPDPVVIRATRAAYNGLQASLTREAWRISLGLCVEDMRPAPDVARMALGALAKAMQIEDEVIAA